MNVSASNVPIELFQAGGYMVAWFCVANSLTLGYFGAFGLQAGWELARIFGVRRLSIFHRVE